MTKVFALGGSVITRDLEDLENIAEGINNHNEQVAVVTGAGSLKKYIQAAETNQYGKDMVGISATRLHAKTLRTHLQDAYSCIPESAEDLEKAANSGKNFVTGGITPGYSTDAVAALCAEITSSKLYIASKVDGIYEKDPEKEDSKKYREITTKKIREVLQSSDKAGHHGLIDRTALRIIERSGLEAKVIEGTPENLVNPEEANGTEIKS